MTDPPSSPLEPESLSKWATDHKDALGFAAACLALVYGLGWVIESFSILRLGLGTMDVSREAAISAGFFFLLSFGGVPLYASAFPTRKGIFIFSAIGFTVGCAMQILFVGEHSFPRSDYLFVQFAAHLGSAIGASVIVEATLHHSQARRLRMMRGVFLSLLFAVLLYIYAVVVVPLLPAIQGGHLTTPVEAWLKDPVDVVDGYLLASDDKGFILAISSKKENPPDTASFAARERLTMADLRHTYLARFRWDRVSEMIETFNAPQYRQAPARPELPAGSKSQNP